MIDVNIISLLPRDAFLLIWREETVPKNYSWITRTLLVKPPKSLKIEIDDLLPSRELWLVRGLTSNPSLTLLSLELTNPSFTSHENRFSPTLDDKLFKGKKMGSNWGDVRHLVKMRFSFNLDISTQSTARHLKWRARFHGRTCPQVTRLFLSKKKTARERYNAPRLSVENERNTANQWLII